MALNPTSIVRKRKINVVSLVNFVNLVNLENLMHLVNFDTKTTNFTIQNSMFHHKIWNKN